MGSIAGYYTLKSFDLGRGGGLLNQMLDTLSERSRGSKRDTVVSPVFGAGIRWPASAADQAPYRHPSGGFVLAMDGVPRIHESGADERSVGDLLKTKYDRWGEGCLRTLDGAFAMALWDGRARRLLLARDAFGQRPLFFSWCDGGRLLLFASEAKAILATRKIEPQFDGRGILDVFSMGHPLSPRSLFYGIEQLPPGAWMSIDDQGRELRGRWYRPTYKLRGDKNKKPIPEQELQAFLRAAIEPVSSETACIVRVDPASALLASHLAQATTDLTTFTLGFDAQGLWPSDFRYAERLADRLDVGHVNIPLAPVDEGEYIDVVRALEIPTLSVQPFYERQLYAALAADGRSKVWSADGASGVFYGADLERHPSTWTRYWQRFCGPCRLSSIPGLSRAFRTSYRLEKRYSHRWGAPPNRLQAWVLIAHVSQALFSDRYRPSLGPSRLPLSLNEPPLFMVRPCHRRLRVYQQTELDGALWQIDRLASHAGLDMTLPYLDKQLVAFAADALPSKLTASPGLNLLRRALPSRLGASIRRRKEQPFRISNPIWPFGPGVGAWVKDLLSGSQIETLGLFDPEAVALMLSRLSRPGVGSSSRLEARVMNAVLGIQVLAKSFRVSDIVWTDD